MNNDELQEKLDEFNTAKGYLDYTYNNLIQFIQDSNK